MPGRVSKFRRVA